MKDRPSIAPGPSQPFTLELRRIWDVEADRTYAARSNRAERNLVAIRTLSGSGELAWKERRASLVTPQGSLILVELPKLARYRCIGATWAFWWFEFQTSAPLPCALNTLHAVAGLDSDAKEFRQIFTKLQNPSSRVRCVASATFAAMLHRWLAETTLRREGSPQQQIVETIIERIHSNVADDWSVPRLAAEAGLSETSFRKAFREVTGQAPAYFVRAARLQAASQMIHQGIYTLAAIAEQLNFSSAFHLSAAYKKHFGLSPSEDVGNPHNS